MGGSQQHDSGTCSLPFGTLTPAVFVSRDNRFRVQVAVDGQLAAAHLPNSGRLGELLVPGAHVWLTPAVPAAHARRRTRYDLTLVEHDGRLVSVDARTPADLVAVGLEQACAPGLPQHSRFRREVTLGDSRLDFWLAGNGDTGECWLEVKSVTLVTGGTARFPDAPTVRGRRHLKVLERVSREGSRAMVVFVIQRNDARSFAPNDATDPEFGDALRRSADAGVEIVALGCEVTLARIQLRSSLPVVL